MRSPTFFDSDVFIYAGDSSGPAEQTRAIQMITDYHRSGSLVISLQVLRR